MTATSANRQLLRLTHVLRGCSVKLTSGNIIALIIFDDQNFAVVTCWSVWSMRCSVDSDFASPCRNAVCIMAGLIYKGSSFAPNGIPTHSKETKQHERPWRFYPITSKLYSFSQNPISIRQLSQLCVILFFFTHPTVDSYPQSVFAAAAAPLASFDRLPHVIFWVWLHLLQFDVSNQYLDPIEDALNKPDRPIPSGRVTLRQAQILRWALVPLCLALSTCYSMPTMWSTVLLCVLTYMYNELHFHAHWITRNLGNAFGFASFEFGATLIAGLCPNIILHLCTIIDPLSSTYQELTPTKWTP